ncbi:FUSC family protein [Nannocystis bainbridge]|uniref:FUSC family protein n=1 Tax=Nannocystis bainbridge TaxID=2995303 RepID=A0ABT5E7V8_9BACT|nr:FUSC family protein [Nannocystis bainbridge]MDC0721513.1 FUSC family protein [Nannocystis bainbridge]
MAQADTGRGFDAAHLADVVVIADAELVRLRQAARVTLTAIAAAALLHWLASALGQPTSVALVGINVAVMGLAVVNDPSPRAQRITTALVAPVACAALVLGSLVHGHAWLRDGLFLAIAFVAVLVRRFGPRGLALGMIAFLAYFFALFFRAAPSRLPLMLTSVGIAAALGYAARFWVVRERPETRLRLRLAALRRTIAVALRQLAAIVAEGREGPRAIRALRRTLGAINESALAIDEQIDRVDPASPTSAALREQVFALELGLQEVAAAAVAATVLGPPAREAAAAALMAARAAVHAGDPAAAGQAIAALTRATRASCELEKALRSLLAALQLDARVPSPRGSDEPGPAAPTPRPTWTWSLRQAAQATLAAGLALAAGHAIASERAYWAVMAAFMVFSRANTRGAVLVRAWQRAIGTIVGVIVGLLVAHAIQGMVGLELGVLFVCMFVAYYTLQFAYTWMVAALTTLIAVLYSLLGLFSDELLYLRVIETLVGASVGAAVAMLVFPVSTRATIRALMVEALGLLADDLAVVYTLPGPERASRRAAARALDRKLRDVRTEVQNAAGAVSLRAGRETSRLFFAFATVCFHARPLLLFDPRALDEVAIARAHAVALRLADRARGLADDLAAGRPPAAPRAMGSADASDPALRGLARLDHAMSKFARVARETRAPRTKAHEPRPAVAPPR